MEPVTTIGLGAVAAYVAKDGIGKLLGPTADYLGDGLRDLTRRRVESIGRIFSNASTKLGSQLDEPGQVPPRVLKTVLNEGSYCEDPVALEYFGGVLASSRTERGRDDRGARVAKVVDNLSTYQLRTHYLIYSSIANLFATSGRRFGMDQDRAQMQVFLPFEGYANAMGFSQEELNNPQILSHVWHGLMSDGLIEGRWQFGDQRSLRRADDRIDVLQLQQMPLIANRGGPLVVQPALVAEADVAALQREPLACPEQHVQEIERRSIAGRGGADRVEEGGGRVARVWPRREEPLGKRGARGEVAPALSDGRQPCGEIVGQDHGQIDHR